MTEQILKSAKAIVAAGAAGAAIAVTDVAAELESQAVILIAGVATGILTWVTPNKDVSAPPADVD